MMYALQVIVLSILFCYVLSNEKEDEMANKYCAKDCSREQIRNCGQDHFPLFMPIYGYCVGKLRNDLSSVEEWDQFICGEDAANEELTVVSDCFFETMNAKYENVDEKLEECFEKSGC
uniref:Venom protein n=1 Tax=Hadrurus spadix TaxID=141984 RepID=A0A1W7R958_9SCOR